MLFPLPPAGLQVAISMNMIGLQQRPLLCTAAHVKEVAEAAEGWYGKPPAFHEMQDISYHLHKRCYPRRVRRAEASGDDNELCELVESIDELAERLMGALVPAALAPAAPAVPPATPAAPVADQDQGDDGDA